MLKFIGICVAVAAVLVYYINQSLKPHFRTPSELNPQYDYIIVGGGTAGSVLAARLSEDPSVFVLLLEAGDDETGLFFSHIPGAVPYVQQTILDWKYFTTPQKKCCGALVDNQSRWPRGKCLGGTSVLNYMHYVRASPADFDQWVKLTGDEAWKFENVLPYFIKSESTTVERLRSSKYHGTDGPLTVSEASGTPLGDVFLEAVKHKGFKVLDDTNNPECEGFSRVQATIKNGKRQSTSAAFLRPVLNRPNLHVVTNAHVNKVTFSYNDEEKQAVGVEYSHGGARHRVLTNREIILSSGTVNTPQLLMLSGIGERQHLESFGIHVVHEIPAVGKNLNDHIAIHTLLTLNESIGVNVNDVLSMYGLLKSTLSYYLFGTGPLAVTHLELTGMIKSGLSKDDRSDMQIYMLPLDPLYEDLTNLVNMKPEHAKALSEQTVGKPTMTLIAVNLHPTSVGEIRLQSADPQIPPLIDPHYFENEKDVDIVHKALKTALDLALTSPSLQRYETKLAELPMPGCEHHALYSDDYWRCVITHRSFTLYHPVSTARMGRSVEDSVVDSKFRVHGVKGLRVVDASAFPDQISGNPTATVIMIAEKVADLIKAAHVK